MSAFDQAQAALDAACDAVFGEGPNGIQFLAKKRTGADPNARHAADAERPAFFVDGVFSEASDSGRPEGRGITSTNVHRVAAGRATVLVSVAMPWQPRQSDQIRLVLRSPVRSFEIVEVHRHEGGTLFEVTPL